MAEIENRTNHAKDGSKPATAGTGIVSLHAAMREDVPVNHDAAAPPNPGNSQSPNGRTHSFVTYDHMTDFTDDRRLTALERLADRLGVLPNRSRWDSSDAYR